MGSSKESGDNVRRRKTRSGGRREGEARRKRGDER
jgi:hypothetical protein